VKYQTYATIRRTTKHKNRGLKHENQTLNFPYQKILNLSTVISCKVTGSKHRSGDVLKWHET